MRVFPFIAEVLLCLIISSSNGQLISGTISAYFYNRIAVSIDNYRAPWWRVLLFQKMDILYKFIVWIFEYLKKTPNQI